MSSRPDRVRRPNGPGSGGSGRQLSQDLPTPTHFEEASQLVTVEMVKGKVACGPDPDRHVAARQAYVDAGYDEVHVLQMGPNQAWQ